MSDDARVRELLRRIDETSGTPEDVCRDCPELLAEVRRRWKRLRAFDARLDSFFAAPDDADDADPRSTNAAPPTFPGYETTELLGSGGMGVVYKAREIGSGHLVALKVIHPHLRTLPGFVERLAREAEIGSRVVHENVVRTVGLATDATRTVSRQALVTEFVEGQTLRALLSEMGRVPEQLCRHVGREISNGLSAIHAVGAVHRDLKPENVLITRDNVVKVMDLGVAKVSDAAADLTDAFVGSLRYAAPEQIQRAGAAIDGRADLYALGLTLYELSTGRHPFEPEPSPTSGGSVVEKTPRRAGALNPQLSAFFEELLARLLEDDRERRFANARDVAQTLEQGEESTWWRERSEAIRRTTRIAPRRIRLARETALHGREADLALLRVGFACASNGDGRAILVQGEAGVGKSRLIDEFVAALVAENRDVHVLLGGYAPGGAATPSGAFSAAYREFFGDADLADALRRRLPDSPALVASFAALLRGEPPPDGRDPLTKDALQTALTRTTQSLAAERPTVVVIEDLHFASDEGRALFAALALAVSGHRVLLVGTARRSLDAKWVADLCRLPHASKHTLQRLGRHELTSLLSDALRSAQAAEELAPLIERKSDGNPFFAFELLRTLRESRHLAPSSDGAWATTEVIREIGSPSSIKDLIDARVAELLPEERETIEVAACCGFEFDPLLVGDVLGLARFPLLRRLGTLESTHRLVRSTGRSCVFDHHQIQEVVYAGLSQTHRESCHAAIAAAIERRTGAADRRPRDVDGALCAVLAEHFFHGAEDARALRYLDAALDHLESRSLNDAAARLAERALAAPGLIDGASRCKLLLRLANCFQRSGNIAGEAGGLREANVLADAHGDLPQRAQARLALGVSLLRSARHGDAEAVLAESAALFRQAGDLGGESRATSHRGATLAVLGRYEEALADGNRGIELSRASGDPRHEAAATCQLGNLFLMLGRHEEARGHLERSAELCREVGDVRTGGRVAANLGNAHLTAGRFADARAQYEDYLARSRGFGDRIGEARANGNLAIVAKSLGRFAESRAHGERCLTLLRECGSRTDEGIAGANHASLLASLGRHDEAQALLDRHLRTAREIGAPRLEACVLGYQGERFAELGWADAARANHERQLQLSRQTGDREGEAAALASLGSLAADAERPDEAIRHLDAAVAIARDDDLPSTLIVAAAQRACLPSGDCSAAVSLLDVSAPRAEVAAVMRARWLLWRATRMTSHLIEASRLFDLLVDHAPPDCRASMAENVPLHRAIRAAAR